MFNYKKRKKHNKFKYEKRLLKKKIKFDNKIEIKFGIN